MANQLSQLLSQWHLKRHDAQWVLGTVYKTEGPSYRKAGAMMLFNSIGQQFGLLSGGCLESDIQSHAKKVMQSGKATSLRYDGSDEDDVSFQLGIGCGGVVYVLLQLLDDNNHFLDLDAVYTSLKARGTGFYHQCIDQGSGYTEAYFEPSDQVLDRATVRKASSYIKQGRKWLQTPILAEPHLLLIGGGVDARPVVSIAHELGWYTTVWDPRPANAREEFFLKADKILNSDVAQLGHYAKTYTVNAAILMAHSVSLDAQALSALHDCGFDYLALLGPRHRREQVLQTAGLSEAMLKTTLAGPAGLDIGGELPESLALAMLAECHATLYKTDASSLSDVLVT